MNQSEFISAIKIAVAESSEKAVLSNLTAPAGRQPSEYLVRLSKWYNALDVDDKKIIAEVVQEAIDSTIFGFLCVLDGVKTIEDSKDKGVLKLFYQKGDNEILLNDPKEDYLHDIW